MSETPVNTQSARIAVQNSARAGAADLRMLAQVEKWMAMIREINRDQTAFSA